MNAISDELLAAQRAINDALLKVVLRSGETYYAYTDDEVIAYCRHHESPDNFSALTGLRNQEDAFLNLNFRGYNAEISWGFVTGKTYSIWQAGHVYALDSIITPVTANGWLYRCRVAGTSHANTEPTWTTNLGQTITDNTVTWEVWARTGQEYSRHATLKVLAQQFNGNPNSSFCYLSCVGIPNGLKEECAFDEYHPDSSNTDTVKTIVNAILGASMSQYNGFTAYTPTWDTTDTLVDSIVPADKFAIPEGMSRYDAVNKLLSEYTKSLMLVKNDDVPHIIDIPSASVYTYSLDEGAHQFFNKTYRESDVIPSKITINTYPDATTPYTGSATDAASHTAFNKEKKYRRKVSSDAEAASVAAAMMSRLKMDSDQGTGEVPMNAVAEVYDYITMTGQAGESRTGNQINLVRVFNAMNPKTRPKDRFKMNLSFGKQMGIGSMGTEIPGFASAADVASLRYDLGLMAQELEQLQDRLRPLEQEPTGFQHLIVFTATDQTHITWTGGTDFIKFDDGTTLTTNTTGSPYAIADDSIYAVYFDLSDAAPATLKVVALASFHANEYKGLLCIFQRGSAAGIKARIIPYKGKMPFITADVIDVTGIIYSNQFQCGTGVKDSTLDGWHIGYDSVAAVFEIVGQLDGADTVVLGTDGKIKILGASSLEFWYSGVKVGELYGYQAGGTALLGNTDIIIGTAADGGINIKAGQISAAGIVDNTLKLEAVDDVLVSATDDISVSATDDLELFGDEVEIGSGGNTPNAAEDEIVISAYAALKLYGSSIDITDPFKLPGVLE